VVARTVFDSSQQDLEVATFVAVGSLEFVVVGSYLVLGPLPLAETETAPRTWAAGDAVVVAAAASFVDIAAVVSIAVVAVAA